MVILIGQAKFFEDASFLRVVAKDINLKVKFEDYTDSLRILLVYVPHKYLRS